MTTLERSVPGGGIECDECHHLADVVAKIGRSGRGSAVVCSACLRSAADAVDEAIAVRRPMHEEYAAELARLQRKWNTPP